MKSSKRVLPGLLLIIFCGCGIFSNNPKNVVSKAINAAKKGSVQDLFNQFCNSKESGAIQKSKDFENAYNRQLSKQDISWDGQEMSPAMIRLFLSSCQTFSVSSVREMAEEAVIAANINYSTTAGPLFIRYWRPLNPPPIYTGIIPKFIDFNTPMGPISPDDPALTKGFEWHRQRFQLISFKIKSVSIEFRLQKINKEWAIYKIMQPFVENSDWHEVSKEKANNFVFDTWVAGMENAANPLSPRDVVNNWFVAGQKGDIKTLSYYELQGMWNYYGRYEGYPAGRQDSICINTRKVFGNVKKFVVLNDSTNDSGGGKIDAQCYFADGTIDTIVIGLSTTNEIGDYANNNDKYWRIVSGISHRTGQAWPPRWIMGY